MACGAVVLTERDRGFDLMFTDQKHLVSFDQDDLEEVVLDLLSDPVKCTRIGNDVN